MSQLERDSLELRTSFIVNNLETFYEQPFSSIVMYNNPDAFATIRSRVQHVRPAFYTRQEICPGFNGLLFDVDGKFRTVCAYESGTEGKLAYGDTYIRLVLPLGSKFETYEKLHLSFEFDGAPPDPTMWDLLLGDET